MYCSILYWYCAAYLVSHVRPEKSEHEDGIGVMSCHAMSSQVTYTLVSVLSVLCTMSAVQWNTNININILCNRIDVSIIMPCYATP
jgi:hypothetical protein